MTTMEFASSFAGVTPQTTLLPLCQMLWFPLDTGTTAATGGTTKAGFDDTGVTLGGSATLTRVNGTLSWQAGGGFVFGASNANAYFAFDPAGVARTFLESMFDFSTYAVDQRLFVAFDLYVPSGYGVNNAGGVTVLGIGDHNATGWIDFGHGSSEIPQVAWKSVGSSAAGSGNPSGGGMVPLVEGEWNAIVIEMVCTAANTFKFRAAHGHDVVSLLSTFTAAFDLSKSDGNGSAPPKLAADNGIRIGAGRSAGGTFNNMRYDSVLRNVWALRANIPVPDSLALFCAREMVALPGCMPLSALRAGRIAGGSYGSSQPTGSAAFTYPPITRSDMFIAYNEDLAIAAQPYFEAFMENGSSSRRSTSLVGFTAAPGVVWTSDAEGEYINRIDSVAGGKKFARLITDPVNDGHGSFLLSSYATDQSLGRREEIVTFGPDVAVIKRTNMWFGARVFLDFDEWPSTNDWVVLWQLKPNPSTSPPLAISFYKDRIDIIDIFNPADGLADSYAGVEGYDKMTHKLAGAAAAWKRKWFDISINFNIDDRGEGGGFYKVFFDKTLLQEHYGPWGLGGLTNSASVIPNSYRYYNVRISNYPNDSGPWNGGVRNVRVRHPFVCKDVQGYSVDDIRAALRAAPV